MSQAQRAYQEVIRELNHCNLQLQRAEKLSERQVRVALQRKEMLEEQLHELAEQIVR